jgi:putative transposase
MGIVKDLVDSDIRILCAWKGCEVEELNVQADHIHMVVSIPPEGINSRVDGYGERKISDKVVQELPAVEKEALLGKSLLVPGLLQGRGKTKIGKMMALYS